MSDTIPLSKYIVERIKQIGVKTVFGVPGDFNLEFLDYIEGEKDLLWAGNANELNAAYAADGYARVKHNLGVIVTTFGVGELSAINGLAGSLAERLPILHIVGTPSTSLQSDHALLHHTLGNGSFDTFRKIGGMVSAATGVLEKGGLERWTEEVDRVLGVALTECRPVYLALPTDLVHAKVSAEGLKTPLPTPHSAPPSSSSSSTSTDPSTPSPILTHVISEISTRFEAAKRPIVIVDVCTSRFGMGEELMRLVEATGMRFFETPMGKSTLDETHPQYGGSYVGANSLPAVREEVESADFVLMSGRLESDFNSGGFTFDLAPKKTVELHSFTTKIGFASYETTDIRGVLPLLTPALGKIVKGRAPLAKDDKLIKESEAQRADVTKVPKEEAAGQEILHKWLWPRVGKFLQEGDLVLAETGTSAFGIINVPFPSKAQCLVQTLWGSIGWATGATLGAAMAASESSAKSRTILWTGEGSLQLTVQEIGTMIRRKVCPYLFVINNDGYEIERQIHGEKAEYNNIQMYDHQLLLKFFAGKSQHPYESFAVHTPDELDRLLNDEAFNKPDKLRLIEVYMPRGDAPAALLGQAKLTAEANAKA